MSGNAKKVLGLADRLDKLEMEVLPSIVGGVNASLSSIQGTTNQLAQLLDAVVAIVGEANVGAKMQEQRLERAQAESAARIEAIKAALKSADEGNGGVKVAERITEESIIVGVEKDKAGTVIQPGRVQFNFSRVAPEFKEALLGQRIGFKMKTPIEGELEVTEIYDPVMPVKKEQPAAAPAPGMDALPVAGPEESPAAVPAEQAAPTPPPAIEQVAQSLEAEIMPKAPAPNLDLSTES